MDNTSNENTLDLGSDDTYIKNTQDVADANLSKLSLPELLEKQEALRWMSSQGIHDIESESSNFFSQEYKRIQSEIEKRGPVPKNETILPVVQSASPSTEEEFTKAFEEISLKALKDSYASFQDELLEIEKEARTQAQYGISK